MIISLLQHHAAVSDVQSCRNIYVKHSSKFNALPDKGHVHMNNPVFKDHHLLIEFH